jgi:hypothetical protein
MHDPFNIFGFFNEVFDHSFVIFVLSDKALTSRESISQNPRDERKTLLVAPRETTGLVQESFDSMAPHCWNELLDESGINLVMSLQLRIAGGARHPRRSRSAALLGWQSELR